ncbi:MAG: hypothetical protein WA120_04240, partial [Candidatus Hydromicrobium sp.]
HFVKILPEKKGIEKNLWAKKFIKKIDYSKEEIALILYYKSFEGRNSPYSASGWAEENAVRNLVLVASKKNTLISYDRDNHQNWLPK